MQNFWQQLVGINKHLLATIGRKVSCPYFPDVVINNFRNALCLIIISFSCSHFISCNSQDPIQSELDDKLKNRKQYQEDKKQRLFILTENLHKRMDGMNAIEKYKAFNQLYTEYSSFQFDSAYKYSVKLCDIGKDINPSYMIDSRIKYSSILSRGGLFKEAMDSLRVINLSDYNISDSIRADYYIALGRIYHDIGDYNHDETFTPLYNSLGNKALREALKLTTDSVTIYWLIGKIELKSNNIDIAKQSLERATHIMKKGDEHQGIIYSTLAHVCYERGDYPKAMNLYMVGAIDNVKNTRRESVALRGLAMTLFYYKKDVNKAAEYINIALDDATLYSARHRKITIGALLPIIVGEKLELIESKHQLLFKYFILIILLVIGLVTLSIITIRQMGKLRQQKKLLETTNDKLSETNLIKEEYLGHYFHINSVIVNQVEQFRQIAGNKLRLKQYNDLKKLIDDLANTYNKKTIYKDFDRTFLKIFPNFVNDFNKLMPESDQITTPEEELSTTLRIFALIRLGITDTEDISRIIDYSYNTVYNYRIRTRKKSLVGSDLFEKYIRNAGN